MSTSSLPVVERLLERLMLSFASVMAKRSPRLHSIGSSRIAAEREKDGQNHRQSVKNITRAFYHFRGYSNIQHVGCTGQYIYHSYANKVMYIWTSWWDLNVETMQSRQLFCTSEWKKGLGKKRLTDSFGHTVSHITHSPKGLSIYLNLQYSDTQAWQKPVLALLSFVKKKKVWCHQK